MIIYVGYVEIVFQADQYSCTMYNIQNGFVYISDLLQYHLQITYHLALFQTFQKLSYFIIAVESQFWH